MVLQSPVMLFVYFHVNLDYKTCAWSKKAALTLALGWFVNFLTVSSQKIQGWINPINIVFCFGGGDRQEKQLVDICMIDQQFKALLILPTQISIIQLNLPKKLLCSRRASHHLYSRPLQDNKFDRNAPTKLIFQGIFNRIVTSFPNWTEL